MNVVVDASIALDLFTTPLHSPAYASAKALFQVIGDGKVIASVPDHFSIEVANAMLKYQRRYNTMKKPKEAIEFLGHLETFHIDYVGYVLSPLIVGQWAAAMNCSAYDAVYIHLARKLDASPATSDKGQMAAAAGFKVPLWEVPASAD